MYFYMYVFSKNNFVSLKIASLYTSMTRVYELHLYMQIFTMTAFYYWVYSESSLSTQLIKKT